MTRLQKIIANLQSTDGGAGENYLREELVGAFYRGWKAQYRNNGLSAELTAFAAFLDEEIE